MPYKGWRLITYCGFQLAKVLVAILYVIFCALAVSFAAIIYLLAAIKERLFDTRCEWRDVGNKHD